MTVLVTGASGFLGGWLANALAQRGEHVRALMRPGSNQAHLSTNVELCRGSLEQPQSLRAAVAGTTHVYHCAALSTDWAAPADFERANVQGVQNLLDALCEAATPPRLIHVSSTDVYGYPEQAGDESLPLRDVGLPYNRSKVLGEQLVWRAHSERSLPVTVVRPGTIYGPRSLSTVGEFAIALTGKNFVWIERGLPSAGLIHVEDAVEGMLLAAHAPIAVGRAYNLCDPRSVTWRQYVDALAQGLDVAVGRLSLPGWAALSLAAVAEVWARLSRAHRPLLTRHAVYLMARDQGFSSERARRELGFAPRVDFEEGMTHTLAWWRERSAGVAGAGGLATARS